MKTLMNVYCMTASDFCGCMTLKVGTIIIAFLGLVPSMFYILLLSVGEAVFQMYGVSKDMSSVLVHIFAAGGVLMAAMHILLIVAAFTYNENLILMYLWFCVAYFVVDMLLAWIITITAFVNKLWLMGVVHIVFVTLYWMILYYYVLPVVNGFRRSITTVVIILA